MDGHRRIANELLRKYTERRDPWAIVWLLELDADESLEHRKVRSTREYSRLWGISRTRVTAIIQEFKNTRKDRINAEKSHPKGRVNVGSTGVYEIGKAGGKTPTPTEKKPLLRNLIPRNQSSEGVLQEEPSEREEPRANAHGTPPGGLFPEDRASRFQLLADLRSLAGDTHTLSEIRYALRTVELKAKAKGYSSRSWPATVYGFMREGWALKGHLDPEYRDAKPLCSASKEDRDAADVARYGQKDTPEERADLLEKIRAARLKRASGQ